MDGKVFAAKSDQVVAASVVFDVTRIGQIWNSPSDFSIEELLESRLCNDVNDTIPRHWKNFSVCGENLRFHCTLS
jgi:hypothetical protein